MSVPTAITKLPAKKFPVKFKRWVEAFLNENSDTYGNATKSALAVYDTKSYSTASVIGHDNRKKLEALLPTVAEGFGDTLPKLLKDLRAAAGSDFDKLERYIVRLGYFTPEPTVQVNAQQNNQFNFNQLGEQIAASRGERGLEVDT